jgi:hypothetical protein
MGIQRLAAAACAVAGVWMLTGPGWALLTAAALLFVAPESVRLRQAADRGRRVVAAAWRWLATGRRAVATASMPAAAVLLPTGVFLLSGVGAGLLAAGLVLGGLSLLAGWNA